MVGVGINSSGCMRVLLNLSDSFTRFSGLGPGERFRLSFLDNSGIMMSDDTGSIHMQTPSSLRMALGLRFLPGSEGFCIG